jgi:hypothetical protein
MSQAPPPSGRWSHPLLLAVAGPLVGGLFAVAVVYIGQSNGRLPTPEGPSTATGATTAARGTTAAPSTSASTIAGSTAVPTGSAYSVLYGPGEIRLGQADLDTVPPRVTAGVEAIDVGAERITGSSASMYSVPFGARPIVEWEGAAPPSPEGCADQLTRLGRSSVDVGVGDTVCVWIDGESVAAVTVNALDPDDHAALVSVIVWTS